MSAANVVSFPDFGFGLSGSDTPSALALQINHPITSNLAPQQSPSIAVDPSDSAHLILAYLDYSLTLSGYAGLAVEVSHNAGASWDRHSLTLPSGFNQGASDPIVKFDDNGHVFICFMAAEFRDLSAPGILNPGGGGARSLGFESNNGIFVARSNDGGLTWAPPVAVTSHVFTGLTQVPFEIYPDMAVDNIRVLPDGKPNPNFGNLYVTWARYYPVGQFPGEPDSTGGSDVMIAVSEDAGFTWQLRTQPRGTTGVADSVLQMTSNTGRDQAPGIGFMNWPRVAVGAQGDVSVADFGGGWFLVNHSVDAGATFFVPSREDLQGLPFGSGGKLLTAGLTNNSFRTVPTRAIAADPLWPGHIYVAEPLPVFDALGNPADSADIFFSRSEDFGRSWKSVKLPGSTISRSVNDDNGGIRSDGSPGNVAADQFMVRMQVNAKGDIGLVWYDTRRDPANHLMDVFAAISTDGGRTFSPNFRVTDQSFDADQGSFVNATGEPAVYLGDTIGLAMSNDFAYVAWTDTRAGNQDIYFRALPLRPPPAPLNDRFEPNDAISQATDLGLVVTTTRPRLALDAGDTDWFRLQSASTGTLTVNVLTGIQPENIALQVLDPDGEHVVGDSEILRNATGQAIGREVKLETLAGQEFMIRVASTDATTPYVLEAKSLAADLGVLVQRDLSGTLNQHDQAYYLFESAAAGVVSVRLAPLQNAQGNARIELLNLHGLDVLASDKGSSPHLNLSVKAGQSLLLRVTSVDSSTNGFQGSYRLQLENLDQYSSPQQSVLQFPAGVGPSQMAIGDFNGDRVTDVAVTNTGANTVSVMLGNGDGTFSSPQRSSVGAFQTPNPVGDDANLFTYRRDILAADFNHDGLLDLVVTNYDSADISVLLGRGDGTFQPQRRFDAAAFPIGVTSGDVNGDGNLDLVVIDSPEINIPNKLAVLLGRGDGTFLPQIIQELPNVLFLAVAALGDLDNDGTLDLVAGGGINDGLDIFRGIGDGSFEFTGRARGSRQATSLVIVDLDGDGNLDVVAPSLSDHNSVTILRGIGDLTFQEPIEIADVGQGPLAVQVVDWVSRTTATAGADPIGSPGSRLDILIANSGVIPGPFDAIGPPGIVLLPNLGNDAETTFRFGDPIELAAAEQPLDLEIADFDGDQALDIAVVDRDGFFVIYGQPVRIQPNLTRETARDLGTVRHIVQPTLTLLPGHQDSWFRLQASTEVVAGAGDQVMDFSAGFAHLSGAGLQMEVLDGQGRSLGLGDRIRVTAAQGDTLFVHVFSQHDATDQAGAGAYTLVINTLPQLVSVEAPSLLSSRSGTPGGPISGLVLVFQGDRLDPATAQDPQNYLVTWLGPDRIIGTKDDRVLIVGEGLDPKQAVIYNPSGNRDASSGRTYPTAVRQTVTLVFADALPSGSYQIEVSPRVRASVLNDSEQSLISPRSGFTNHSVASITSGGIQEGSRQTLDDLVAVPSVLAKLADFQTDTRFLTQLHADLGALLDRILSEAGDIVERNTDDLLAQIIARLDPALGPPGKRIASLLVVLVDPASPGIIDPIGKSFSYDLQTNRVTNQLSRGVAEVGGNVELVMILAPIGIHQLNLADVPPLARAGWAHLGNQGNLTQNLTEAIRNGERSFAIGIAELTPLIAAVGLAPPPIFAPASLSVIAWSSIPQVASVTKSPMVMSPTMIPAAQRDESVRDNDSDLANWNRFRQEWNRLWNDWFGTSLEPQSSWLRVAQELLKIVIPLSKWNTATLGLFSRILVRRARLDVGHATSVSSPASSRPEKAFMIVEAETTRTKANINGTPSNGTPSNGTPREHNTHTSSNSNVAETRKPNGTFAHSAGLARGMASVPANAGSDANRKQVPSKN